MQARIVRVTIRNYKSIAQCAVALHPLTVLVGPNGAGKSNFIDALRFVADSLNTTIEQALRDRGGIASVRRISRGHPRHFGLQVEVVFPDQAHATYAFQIGAEPNGGFSVQREVCRIAGIMQREEFFEIEDGTLVRSSCAIPAAIERDRLGLVAISGLSEFRPVYDSLRGMTFFSLNPERIRDLQDPDPGQALARDGRNLAALIRELARFDGGRVLHEISEHLAAIAPGIVAVEHKSIGPKETIEFRQQVAGDDSPWRFLAANMSDGTLRALGILVAVFQATAHARKRISLVGIEEPEIALHPGAVQVLGSAIVRASHDVQVLATTHSPELLDHKDLGDQSLYAVSVDKGDTIIGPVSAAVRSAIRDRLYSVGDLLRMGQIEPDRDAAEADWRQSRLFGGPPDEQT